MDYNFIRKTLTNDLDKEHKRKRKIIRGIINNSYTLLSDIGLEGKDIKMVYTIFDEESIYMKFDPMTGKPLNKSLDHLLLNHHQNVFIEDRGHDWNIYGDKFKYYAHSSAMGDKVDILIEYE